MSNRTEIYDAISTFHEQARGNFNPGCLLITGPSGCGKTSMARHYEQEFPRRSDGGEAISPVLYATICAKPTLKGLVRSLLYSLGDQENGKNATIDALTNRLISLVKRCEVELIILDEFHHLEALHYARLAAIVDWLRYLHRETDIAMVFLCLGMARTSFLEKLPVTFQRRLRYQEVGCTAPIGSYRSLERTHDHYASIHQGEMKRYEEIRLHSKKSAPSNRCSTVLSALGRCLGNCVHLVLSIGASVTKYL